MMISTRGRYALRMLVDLAEHRDTGYLRLVEIAERQEISEKYLESIAKDLVKAGFLEGLRGKGGGYRLARPAELINAYDVLLKIEGELAPVACLVEGSKPCQRAPVCRTLPLWKGLDTVVREYLQSYTIQDLIQSEESGNNYII